MDFEQIRYEVADGVLTITLNRPDRLNAFTETMMNELIAAFDAADADDDVRAVIVTGEGRGFCAGADLAAGGETLTGRSAPPPATSRATGVAGSCSASTTRSSP
jgi:enoyl-CoA hydratase/carnithine racemase